jgi:hypothetical protein
MTHVGDDLLTAVALGDATSDERERVEAHVKACAACRDILEDTRRVLKATSDLEEPGRGDEYGARVWARIEPRLPKTAGDSAAWLGASRGWLAAAAVLLIAIGAFLAGRWSHDTPQTQTQAPTATRAQHGESATQSIRERVVLAALGDHLDRTERALVELVNADSAGTVDITAEQAWARDLLEANRIYRQSASGAASPALVALLGELEPVLLEIVHSPSRLTADDYDALRARIEDRSLLFKVRVTGASLRARQRSLIHTGAPTS